MEKLERCSYNEKGVTCPPKNRKCYICGWNPSIAKIRENILRAYGFEVLQYKMKINKEAEDK